MAGIKPTTILLLFLFLNNFTFAQAQKDSLENETVVWTKAAAFIPTKVALPDNFKTTEPHPLIIGLHGYGSTAEGFLSISKPFTDAGFIFAAPQAPYPVLLKNGELVYEWFLYDISSLIMLERPASDLEIAAMRLTSEKLMGQVIDNLKATYNVNKIYVAGFSQGGIITYLTGIHHHDKIDGMIIFSSVVDEDWLGDDDIKEGHAVRTLILQGETDTLVPIQLAEAERDLLLKNGYAVTYKKFDGKHIIPKDLLGYVIEWMDLE